MLHKANLSEVTVAVRDAIEKGDLETKLRQALYDGLKQFEGLTVSKRIVKPIEESLKNLRVSGGVVSYLAENDYADNKVFTIRVYGPYTQLSRDRAETSAYRLPRVLTVDVVADYGKAIDVHIERLAKLKSLTHLDVKHKVEAYNDALEKLEAAKSDMWPLSQFLRT